MAALTLPQLDDLMRSTVSVRRAVVADVLASRAASPEAVDHLREVLATLESIPEDAGGRTLRLEDDRPIHLDLAYEIEELRKDLLFLSGGEGALRADLVARHESLPREVDTLAAALSGTRFQSFVTDRDGTVNNYCGRYASSVQSAWNAVFLARFAARRVRHAVVLTSAPLQNVGLVDLAVTPAGAFVYAGSKGREYLDREGRRRQHPIDAARQEKLDALNRRLEHLLEEPGHAVFARIGSGFQHKFGQTTVARQDVAASIPTAKSEQFRDAVRGLVHEVDPEGAFFAIEDTGLDIEVTLTAGEEGGGERRGFDKGDGVRFLDADVPLRMEAGACLVCGDTDADVPMVEAARERAPAAFVVFVTRREELRARVRSVHPGALFVSEPDALVAALGDLGTKAGGH